MSRKWWILAAVGCGTFMATLDSSIVNIALPTLTQAMQTDLSSVKWVIIVYLLVITCTLLPFGRLSDQYGRKKVYQSGFLIFIGGSALCGISPSLGWLVASRAIQGVGASMLMANGPAIITAAFPASERGGALGTLAMVVSAGLLSGPSLGGLIVTHFGWPFIFIINIPVGLLGVAMAARFIEHDPRSPARLPFDWAGALLQTIFLLSFMTTFDPPKISMTGDSLIPVPRWVMALVTLIFGALFVKVESLAPAPLFDLSLLKNRTFWTGNLSGFLMFVALSSVTVLMPFFLENILHYGPSTAGVFMTAVPVMIFVVAPLSGRLSDRIGCRELTFAGAAIAALGLLAMAGLFGSGLYARISTAGIVILLGVIGLAMGLFQSPNNSAIMGAVATAKLGVASALLATVRNLGLVTGTGLATGLFTWRMSTSGDFVSSLHFTHLVAGLVGIAAAAAALGKSGRIPGRGGRKHGAGASEIAG